MNMKITLRPIDRSNYNQCIRLKVRDDQKDFVAPNEYSLVQAAYEPDLYPLGIYDGNEMVGFILYDFDEEINGWSMSRFMIDESLQGRGYGKAAIKEFIRFFKEKYPNERKIYTSAEVDNHIAIYLYESIGFVKGEVFSYEFYGKAYHEVRMVLNL